MCLSEGERLSQFSVAVRESTVKRLKRVPEGAENWAPNPNSMSFADLVQHLIDADEWLFKMLETKNLPPTGGKVGAVDVGRRDEYLQMIDELQRTGQARQDLLDRLSEEQLEETLDDARFEGPVTAWWVIVRGNLDHEIHHRGEINAYLNMVKI